MSASVELLRKINSGEYDRAFGFLYGEAQVSEQRARYTKAVEEFRHQYFSYQLLRPPLVWLVGVMPRS